MEKLNTIPMKPSNDDPLLLIGASQDSAYQYVAAHQSRMSLANDVAPMELFRIPLELWFRVQTISTGYSRWMDTDIQLTSAKTRARTLFSYELNRSSKDDDSGWWKSEHAVQDPGDISIIGDAWDNEGGHGDKGNAWPDFLFEANVAVYDYGLYYDTVWRVHPQLTHNDPHPTASKRVLLVFKSKTLYTPPPQLRKIGRTDIYHPPVYRHP